MQKLTAIAIAIALVVGIAVAAVVGGISRNPDSVAVGGASTLAGSGDVEARLKALEAAVASEREARQLLEDELLILYEALESIETGDEPAPVAVGDVRRETSSSNPRRQIFGSRNDPEWRLAQLTEAGFSMDRAEFLVKRESELRMEAMQARYDAMRSPDGVPADQMSFNPELKLRQEIGESEYEMYLVAQDRPTAVNIRDVLSASPAQTAGLQPGDQITHYDGARVFSTFDLTRQTMEGESGGSVIVNIVRDGAPMQVVMQRGPLGISTSRRR